MSLRLGASRRGVAVGPAVSVGPVSGRPGWDSRPYLGCSKANGRMTKANGRMTKADGQVTKADGRMTKAEVL